MANGIYIFDIYDKLEKLDGMQLDESDLKATRDWLVVVLRKIQQLYEHQNHGRDFFPDLDEIIKRVNKIGERFLVKGWEKLEQLRLNPSVGEVRKFKRIFGHPDLNIGQVPGLPSFSKFFSEFSSRLNYFVISLAKKEFSSKKYKKENDKLLAFIEFIKARVNEPEFEKMTKESKMTKEFKNQIDTLINTLRPMDTRFGRTNVLAPSTEGGNIYEFIFAHRGKPLLGEYSWMNTWNDIFKRISAQLEVSYESRDEIEARLLNNSETADNSNIAK